MPDDFEPTQKSLGSDNEDDFAPGTAGTGDDQDLLGQDAAQSDDDLGGTPPDHEEDSSSPGELFDEGDYLLLQHDPDRGMEKVKEKINRFVKSQQKSYTKRMTKIAREAKEKDTVVRAYRELEARMARIQQDDPDFYHRFVEKVSGGGQTASASPAKRPTTVDELIQTIDRKLDEKLGRLQSAYMQDKASGEVDSFIKRAKNPKLNEIRDKLLDVKTRNPDFTMKQVLATADPDLFADLSYEARRRKNMPAGGERTASEFSTPRRSVFKDLKSAFDAAWSEKGGLPPA